MRVELGNGQHAEIHDLEDVPRRAKFRIQEWTLGEYRKDEMHPALITIRTQELMIANVITSWTLDKSIPNGDIEAVRDLSSGQYDKLLEATEEHVRDLDFIRTSPSSSGSRTTSGDESPPDTSQEIATSAP